MFGRIILLFALLCPALCYAGPEAAKIEQIRLAFIEKFYDENADMFRRTLAAAGVSEEEIEGRLFEAVDEMSHCVLVAVEEQAIAQGLPVATVLEAFGDGATGPQNELLIAELDTEALNERSAPCTRNLIRKVHSKTDKSAT